MAEKKPLPSRREFMKKSSIVTSVAGVAASQIAISQTAHAAGDDKIKIGLVGCGGRGSGAAANALAADPSVKLVAMADVFPDQLQKSLSNLSKNKSHEGRIDVPEERQFIGFDAYKKLIPEVDVVLLTTPPHFRPMQLKAAVDAGKHCFVEKPVAVDGPGIRSIFETVKKAQEKNLSIVSGLCWRYHNPKRDTMNQIFDGKIGDITSMQCTYNTGQLWLRPRQEDWSDMEWQMRNWLYFTWLSGDHNVEQHIHSLDKMVWVMKDQAPLSAVGVGGRQQRTGAEYGNVFDHHSVTYEFPGGVKAFAQCRQMNGCSNDVSDHVFGTKGNAALMSHIINFNDGSKRWRSREKGNNMYVTEHAELYEGIKAGRPINNGDYMTKSTLMAIMGRMATYTGKKVSYEDALNSTEDLSPAKYEWGEIPTPEIAIPGITKFS